MIDCQGVSRKRKHASFFYTFLRCSSTTMRFDKEYCPIRLFFVVHYTCAILVKVRSHRLSISG